MHVNTHNGNSYITKSNLDFYTQSKEISSIATHSNEHALALKKLPVRKVTSTGMNKP